MEQKDFMKKLFFIPLIALLISFQPSKITQTWSAKGTVSKKYQQILVLGVLTDNDYELPVKMETLNGWSAKPGLPSHCCQ